VIIKRDIDTILSYFEDSSNLKGGSAQAVAFPENTAELSAFLKDADSRKIPVTISGGGTGTAGGRIPFGGYGLSMERFNRIIDVSTDRMSAVVQAGAPVEGFKEACEKKGLFYTSHPTEKTAFVGGTVATNASGARSFKYGPTRKYVKMLRMVLANGELLDIKRGETFITKKDPVAMLSDGSHIKVPVPSYRMPAVKNSAGYYAEDGMDLIDLFIGQEGTLSVIAEIELALVKKPAQIFSCFVFFKKEKDAIAFSRDAKALGALSIEYFDSNSLCLLRAKSANVPDTARAAVFFEQELTGEDDDRITGEWIKLISSSGSSENDTWAAMNEREAEKFIDLRHSIPESINEIVRSNGFQKLSTDIAVPDDKFSTMMDYYMDTFRENKIGHAIFGHIGESHVHVNLLPKTESQLELAKDIALKFVKKGVSLGGTISAEHGVGKTKHKYLEAMYGRGGILEMARIKKAFDPHCILGLDNIFPKEILDEV
jgi:D-lactate dehydrogenase (cytochrome)